MDQDQVAEEVNDPAALARELREIHARLLANAEQAPGKPNGVVIAHIPLRFAMKNRIERLCAALGVPPEQVAG